jgi:Flp pilus assembly pilin Flp
MHRLIALARRLVGNLHGAMYVEYTSLLLLVAIAAVAVFATSNGGNAPN